MNEESFDDHVRRIEELYELSIRVDELIRVNSQWDAEYKELLEGSQQYRYDAQKAQSSQAVIDKLKHQRDDHELKREVALLRDELNKSHKKMHSLQKIDYKPRARDLEDEVALLRQQLLLVYFRLFERLIMRLLITRLINAKLVLLLVYSLATVVALLRALRSGWGPPLELALSLSNDNYWQVFVDVFADLLACVWSNPDTQHTLLGIFCTLFAVSFLMNGLLIYTLVNGNSATQNSSFYLKSNPSQVELCTAVSSRSELHQALAEVGDWYGLCLGLEISDSISQPLRHSSKDVTDKKRVCLDAFYDLGEGEACWERVVRVVTGYPIHKRGLAKKLAKKFGIDFEDAVTRRYEL